MAASVSAAINALGLQRYTPMGGRPDWSTHDDATVARMRRLRAGWDAIAKALGRSKADTRAHYDPDYLGAGDTGPAKAASLAPSPPTTGPIVKARARTAADRVNRDLRLVDIEALVALERGPLTSSAVAQLCDRWISQVSEAMGALKARGFVAKDTARLRSEWDLTPAGRAYLAGLADV